MNQQPDSIRDRNELKDSSAISRWARIYARNRTLGIVVMLVVFAFIPAAIALPSYLLGNVHIRKQTPLVVACLAVMAVGIAGVICVSIPWGWRRMRQFGQVLYAREGSVTAAPPHSMVRKPAAQALVFGFSACILLSVVLGMLGYIPDRYMQPVSALYVVPFLVLMCLLKKHGMVLLLWPALYALHAILIVAGAPILFTGEWVGLNMLIPVAGYGIVAGLIAHAYNRFALHRLRRLAQMDLPDAGRQEEQQR